MPYGDPVVCRHHSDRPASNGFLLHCVARVGSGKVPLPLLLWRADFATRRLARRRELNVEVPFIPPRSEEPPRTLQVLQALHGWESGDRTEVNITVDETFQAITLENDIGDIEWLLVHTGIPNPTFWCARAVDVNFRTYQIRNVTPAEVATRFPTAPGQRYTVNVVPIVPMEIKYKNLGNPWLLRKESFQILFNAFSTQLDLLEFCGGQDEAMHLKTLRAKLEEEKDAQLLYDTSATTTSWLEMKNDDYVDMYVGQETAPGVERIGTIHFNDQNDASMKPLASSPAIQNFWVTFPRLATRWPWTRDAVALTTDAMKHALQGDLDYLIATDRFAVSDLSAWVTVQPPFFLVYDPLPSTVNKFTIAEGNDTTETEEDMTCVNMDTTGWDTDQLFRLAFKYAARTIPNTLGIEQGLNHKILLDLAQQLRMADAGDTIDMEAAITNSDLNTHDLTVVHKMLGSFAHFLDDASRAGSPSSFRMLRVPRGLIVERPAEDNHKYTKQPPRKTQIWLKGSTDDTIFATLQQKKITGAMRKALTDTPTIDFAAWLQDTFQTTTAVSQTWHVDISLSSSAFWTGSHPGNELSHMKLGNTGLTFAQARNTVDRYGITGPLAKPVITTVEVNLEYICTLQPSRNMTRSAVSTLRHHFRCSLDKFFKEASIWTYKVATPSRGQLRRANEVDFISDSDPSYLITTAPGGANVL